MSIIFIWIKFLQQRLPQADSTGIKFAIRLFFSLEDCLTQYIYVYFAGFFLMIQPLKFDTIACLRNNGAQCLKDDYGINKMHDMFFPYCISLSSSFRIFSLAFRLFLFSRACVLKISFMDTKNVCWGAYDPGFAATGLAQLTRWIVITCVIFQSTTLAIL